MKTIEIFKKTPIAGTTEWLKEELRNCTFRFSTTTDDEPCVVCDKYKKIKNGVEREKTILLAFVPGKPEPENDILWRNHKGKAFTAYPSCKDPEPYSMFNYLTDNAKRYCDELIGKVADVLLAKLDADREEMTIEVNVK
jgi:hypothetical protein